MIGRLYKLTSRAAGWVANQPATIFMLGGDERFAAEPPERFERAWLGLAAGAMFWGIVLANVWGISWKVFHDPEYYLIMPHAITLALYCLWPFKRAVVALGRQLGGQSVEGRTVAVAVVVVVLAMSLMRLNPDSYRWEFQLPWWIDWLRPKDKLHRVLVLMPAWGTWAMLITLKFCRPGQRTEPQLAALARGCDAVMVAVIMAVLLGVSIFYFHYLGLGGQVLVPLATIVAAIAGGVGFNRAPGGLTRQGLLAANLVAQIAFLMAYLVGR